MKSKKRDFGDSDRCLGDSLGRHSEGAKSHDDTIPGGEGRAFVLSPGKDQ